MGENDKGGVVRIFLHHTEEYPVARPSRTRRRDHGADVPVKVVIEFEYAERLYWTAMRKLERAYQKAQIQEGKP